MQCNYCKLPNNLEYVGDGHTVRKTDFVHGYQAFEFMKSLVKHLQANPDPLIVSVSNFQFVRQQKQQYWYSYDMARLDDITEEESHIVWAVGDAWRAGFAEPWKKFKKDSQYTVEYAWEKYPKLMSFCQKVVKQNRYGDLHGENVMQDQNNNYRLIDLEGFLNPPLELISNNWINVNYHQHDNHDS
jgi:hypothetical protein